ncbi:uncharacterized protein A4U43_C07F37230 [Asparagus officinalis]|uniref:Methyltransferase n=1 Tax=Asparagus officinalis TaxID=4686 RepID=A0A5P1EKY2_ASPOF|nr:uncharacterized protein A4U43_C07F37230 [Asparagus officinalis]
MNNNDCQISRGMELNNISGLGERCNFVKADFLKLPFADNTFDAVYTIEPTCHAPDALGCYKEIFAVLKPGPCVAAYECCMTNHFDPENEVHQMIKSELELSNGLPDIRSTSQCLVALKLAGFEVVWEKDLAVDSPLPWYLPLDINVFSITRFRLTSFGRFITKSFVKTLQFVGLSPAGSDRDSSFLEKAAGGLVEGGRKEIFTPMYFFIVRKSRSDS